MMIMTSEHIVPVEEVDVEDDELAIVEDEPVVLSWLDCDILNNLIGS